ncbi:MAG: hypothetical protein ACXABY_00140 [Candidatus Thorarchaeota archaeon]|jgi:hypothetical protein
MTEDAKLSTKKRKSLKGSTFCGPGRSFPVPDCAHVTAARRLIGRAKVSSSTKSKILSCVSRKAKQMGCGGGKSKDSSEDIDLLISSEGWQDTRDFVEWLEGVEAGRTVEDEASDNLRERAAKTLAKLRGQAEDEVAIHAYNQRNIYSLFDSILDQLEG